MTDSPPPHRSPAQAAWPLRLMASALLLLGVFPMAELLDIAEPQRWWTFAARAWMIWVPATTLLALLLAWRLPRQVDGFVDRWSARLLAPSRTRFTIALAVFTGVLALLVSGLMFRFEPSVLDELTQLWQAHLLANGHLYATAEAHPEFFSTSQTIMHDGRWFAHFPIGGPVLQAIGLVLRAPALVNPVLSGVAAVAIHRFVSRTGDEREARAAALLFALSPFALILAASRLDQTATLAFVWIALAALPRWFGASRDADAGRAAAVIGVSLGVATTIRPYDGAIATATIGIFQLVAAGRSAPRWRSLGVQLLAGLVPIVALLIVNRALTGDPLRFAYDVVNGAEHRPGFHLSPLGHEHTPIIGLYHVSSYLMRLNAVMLGWPVPVLALAAVALYLRRPVTRWDHLLVALMAVTFAAYFVYWGDGNFHGPRFFFVLVPALLLFVERFPALAGAHLPPLGRRTVLLLVPIWIAAAWLVPPGRLEPYGVWNLTVGNAEPPNGSSLLAGEVRRRGLQHALVFVTDGWQARLTARMRALGIAPHSAHYLATEVNACLLQQRLDAAEASGAPRGEQARWVADVARQRDAARPVPGLAASDLIALPKSSVVPAPCEWDFDHAVSLGVDLSRLLPLVSLDSAGRLDGDVVYARHFGARDARLRSRFPDRQWYVATLVVRGDTLGVDLAPWAP